MLSPLDLIREIRENFYSIPSEFDVHPSVFNQTFDKDRDNSRASRYWCS